MRRLFLAGALAILAALTLVHSPVAHGCAESSQSADGSDTIAPTPTGGAIYAAGEDADGDGVSESGYVGSGGASGYAEAGGTIGEDTTVQFANGDHSGSGAVTVNHDGSAPDVCQE